MNDLSDALNLLDYKFISMSEVFLAVSIAFLLPVIQTLIFKNLEDFDK